MKRDIIIKCITLFSIGFTIVTVIELIDIILFSTIIEIQLDGQYLIIFTLFFNSGFTTLHVIIIWISLISLILGFSILGLVLLIIMKRNTFDDNNLSKHLLMIGMFLLITGLIKMEFIYFLAHSEINYNGSSILFQNALYNPTITPFIGSVMWIYFSAIGFCILISGLVFGGTGLKWILSIEKEKR